MNGHELELEKLGKASRRAAILSALGAVVVLSSLAYSGYSLNSLYKQKDSLDKQITEKKEQLTELTKELDHLKGSINDLSYASISPQNRVFQLKASASRLKKDIDGTPYYWFSINVQGSKDVVNQIEKVGYDRNDRSFLTPYVEETNPNNNFTIGWKGWGCLTQMPVTIFWKDNKPQTINFDMCKGLGPSWEEEE